MHILLKEIKFLVAVLKVYFKTCVLTDSNLWGKLFPSLESPTASEEIFKGLQYLFLFLTLIYYVAN